MSLLHHWCVSKHLNLTSFGQIQFDLSLRQAAQCQFLAYNTLVHVCYFFVYFHLIQSDFKLSQKWLTRSHFIARKTYISPQYLKTITDSSLAYNTLLYYFLVYVHLILLDFKLPNCRHFIVWKTYFEDSRFARHYIILLFGVILCILR